MDSDDDEKFDKSNESELLTLQGKEEIVVTAKSLKRKLESEFKKNEPEENENPQKKIAPLIEKAEITITPIQKVSATADNGTVA